MFCYLLCFVLLDVMLSIDMAIMNLQLSRYIVSMAHQQKNVVSNFRFQFDGALKFGCYWETYCTLLGWLCYNFQEFD